jgi:hypothetical protein
MTFVLDIPSILKYAVNVFTSFMPLAYLFIGGSFAVWLVRTIIQSFKGG